MTESEKFHEMKSATETPPKQVRDQVRVAVLHIDKTSVADPFHYDIDPDPDPAPNPT